MKMYEVQYLNGQDYNPPRWTSWFAHTFDTAEQALDRRDTVRKNRTDLQIRAVEVVYVEI